MRRISNKYGIPYAEVNKVFRSQFQFAKEKIEELDKETLSTASKQELEEIVFNFLYLGKIHTNEALQKLGNKKNNKGEDNE